MRPGDRVKKHINRSLDASRVYAAVDAVREDAFVVWTNGCFDLVHPGHVDHFLEIRDRAQAWKKVFKKNKYVVIIGMNTDASIFKLKKRDPLFSLEYRVFVLRKVLDSILPGVAFIPIEGPDLLQKIKRVKPDVLVKGGDYRGKPVIGQKEVKSWGGITAILGYCKGISTTILREQLA